MIFPFFFFNDTATTEIYTLSLHDALPICLRDLVAEKLKADWSPEQISGWLKRKYPSDEAMYVSHETIYRTLFVQARGALKRELLAHLRSRRLMRRDRKSVV